MTFHQPDLRPIGERRYRLAAPYLVRVGRWVFSIPAGLETDGASVPRWAWSIFGIRPNGLIRAGALIHDALYQYAGVLPRRWVVPWHPFSRAESDGIFYDLMRKAGMRKRDAWRAWFAVRVGGLRSWLHRSKSSA